MNKSSDPILRQRGMALAGDIFRQKDVAGTEGFFRAVADAYLTGAGKRDAPLAPRRVVPAQDIAVVVVFENQCLGGDGREKILRGLCLIQVFKVRLAVIAGIHSAELHKPSGEKFTLVFSSIPLGFPRQGIELIDRRIRAG